MNEEILLTHDLENDQWRVSFAEYIELDMFAGMISMFCVMGYTKWITPDGSGDYIFGKEMTTTVHDENLTNKKGP